jgi:SAM-dependent methyltransferase
VLGRRDTDHLVERGDLALPDDGERHVVLEHERVWFPSFPYEWPPEMLHAAASLTLDIAARLLREDLGIKDGTPYNVLFEGPNPVFVDILSFERRQPGDAIWLPYAQFARSFLLPLLAGSRLGLSCRDLLLGRRDGIEPEELYAWAGGIRKFLPPFLSLVSLPKWLSGSGNKGSLYQPAPRRDPEQARFILETLFGELRRKVRKVQPRARKSAWLNYVTANTYTTADYSAKQQFVREALDRHRPARVLDIGCNTGDFSAIAARSGARVVAIDHDEVSAGDLWKRAAAEKLDILPLVVNLARPTQAVGWRNQENRSFLERARGSFDCVLMLAVLHHLLVTERVPLPEVLRLASELTTDLLVIELVLPGDSMFRSLSRGRDHLHADLTRDAFEAARGPCFEILKREQMGNMERRLYVLRKRNPASQIDRP